MAAWREEDHPRDERGRWTVKGMQARAQIKRTVAAPESAHEDELMDVYVRLVGKKALTRTEEQHLLKLDAELNRREAGGERQPTAQERRADELIADGWSYEDAYREAYGGQDGDEEDVSGRRRGETREQMRRRQYSELTALAVLEAEDATNGYLLNKAGRAAKINAASLFTGPRPRAMKWASEELRRHWETHPRRTYAEYRAEVMGDSAGARKARSTRRQAGNGEDFGG